MGKLLNKFSKLHKIGKTVTLLFFIIACILVIVSGIVDGIIGYTISDQLAKGLGALYPFYKPIAYGVAGTGLVVKGVEKGTEIYKNNKLKKTEIGGGD